MTDIDLSALDRELKKGAAELLLLSVLEARPRHGYELGKLIETQSGGRLVFHLDSLYPLLYRLEERGWIKGTWVEKAGERRRRFYRLTPTGQRVLLRQRQTWDEFVEAVRLVTEGNMPDWKSHIRPRLAPLRLSPAREAEIAEELAQHLEDRWRELVASGATPEEAAQHRADRIRRRPTRSPSRNPAPGALARNAAAGSVARVLVRQRPHRSASRHPGTESDAQLHARRAARAGVGHGRHDRDLLRRRRGRAPAAAVSRTGPYRRGGRARGRGRRGRGPQRSGPVPRGRPQGAPPLWAMPGAKPPEPDALMNVTSQDYLDWADQQQVFESMAAIADAGDTVLQRPDAELGDGERATRHGEFLRRTAWAATAGCGLHVTE